MKRFNAGEAFALVIYLAAIYTLVRPGSQGPGLVKTVGDVLANLITAATGAGGWTAGGSSTGGTVFA